MTFYRDVLPILQQRCQVCHRRGEIAPMPLVTYRQVKPYAHRMEEATRSREMPPWFADPHFGHFADDPSLSPQEIATLAAWADAGAPAGNAHDAPPPRQWAPGWAIPQPDLVVPMPKPVDLPAHGDIEYTYEIVPTGFTAGKWVQMSEVRPLARASVHHAVVYIRPPGSTWLKHAPVGTPFTASTLADAPDRRNAHWTDSDILLVYAPGSSPDRWPAGMAKYIPAGGGFRPRSRWRRTLDCLRLQSRGSEVVSSPRCRWRRTAGFRNVPLPFPRLPRQRCSADL